eukprot:12882342-Prorocentrum_lima.AAC.1
MNSARIPSLIVSAIDIGISVFITLAMSSKQHAEGACICSTNLPKPTSTTSLDNSLRGSRWSIW